MKEAAFPSLPMCFCAALWEREGSGRSRFLFSSLAPPPSLPTFLPSSLPSSFSSFLSTKFYWALLASGTVLSPGEIVVNKTDKVPASCNLRDVRKQIIKKYTNKQTTYIHNTRVCTQRPDSL